VWVEPNTVIHVAQLDVSHEPVPSEQSVRGVPTTGSAELGDFGGLEIGVWEMSTGTMTDVEVDELFIVVSGSATVEFPGGHPPLELQAGDVVQLAAGTQTVWTVTEPLRKVYLTPRPDDA
jgi:uncharacterized protein